MKNTKVIIIILEEQIEEEDILDIKNIFKKLYLNERCNVCYLDSNLNEYSLKSRSETGFNFQKTVHDDKKIRCPISPIECELTFTQTLKI